MRVKGEGEGEGRGERWGERGTIMVINYEQEKRRPLLITCLSANRILYEVSVTKTHGPPEGRNLFLFLVQAIAILTD